MKDSDLLKEFIRDAYNADALDLGTDRKFLEDFIRIFAGEQEAFRPSRLRHILTRTNRKRSYRWKI